MDAAADWRGALPVAAGQPATLLHALPDSMHSAWVATRAQQEAALVATSVF